MKSGNKMTGAAAKVVLALALAATAAAGARADDAQSGNDVTFRGGWAGLVHSRGDQVFTDVGGAGGQNNSHGGYYVGGALDMLLTRDAWGMMSNVWAQGEVGLEYKRFNSNNVVSAAPTLAASVGGTANIRTAVVPLTMLDVDVAPKLRYAGFGKFQPWIIPVGLDFTVISPPSNGTGYLDVGAIFGVGADYQVWKAFKVGLDARYHITAGATGTQNNFGTVGSYVAIGF